MERQINVYVSMTCISLISCYLNSTFIFVYKIDDVEEKKTQET